MRGRAVWVWLHKWIGLVLGAVMAILGLTGSVIVFYRELDVALNPALFVPSHDPALLPVADIIRIAGAAAPEPALVINMPDAVVPVYAIQFLRAGHYWTTHVDTAGKVLGIRDFDASFAFMTYKLHFCLLLLDYWGMEAIGVLGLLLVVSASTGLYLWWPGASILHAMVTVRRRPLQRLYLDLHNVAGSWASILLMVVALTGAAVTFPGLLRPTVNLFSAVQAPHRASVPDRPAPYGLGPDAVIGVANAHSPGLVVTFLQAPRKPQNLWRVGLRPADASLAIRYASQLWIDPWTGAVVEDGTPSGQTAGDRFMAGQLWLHNGALLGWTGRFLVFLSGLILPVLFVTGVLLWFRRGKVKRAFDKRRSNALRESA